jgi:hypothetical protein
MILQEICDFSEMAAMIMMGRKNDVYRVEICLNVLPIYLNMWINMKHLLCAHPSLVGLRCGSLRLRSWS